MGAHRGVLRALAKVGARGLPFPTSSPAVAAPGYPSAAYFVGTRSQCLHRSAWIGLGGRQGVELTPTPVPARCPAPRLQHPSPARPAGPDHRHGEVVPQWVPLQDAGAGCAALGCVGGGSAWDVPTWLPGPPRPACPAAVLLAASVYARRPPPLPNLPSCGTCATPSSCPTRCECVCVVGGGGAAFPPCRVSRSRSTPSLGRRLRARGATMTGPSPSILQSRCVCGTRGLTGVAFGGLRAAGSLAVVPGSLCGLRGAVWPGGVRGLTCPARSSSMKCPGV